MDMLLHIQTYPEALPTSVVDDAVGLAARLGGRLSAFAPQVYMPTRSNRLADFLISLSKLAMEEEARSLDAAQTLLAHFRQQVEVGGVLGEALLERADFYDVAELFARRARARDLAIIPAGQGLVLQQEAAQAAIFGSGRPVLLMPQTRDRQEAEGLGRAVVAWDGSRCAARAVADAVPLLKKAHGVTLVTVTDEKPLEHLTEASDIARHLRTHGIEAMTKQLESDGAPIGRVLEDYVRQQGAELLVMGAYGHSRLREFILGGATEHMLRSPSSLVLLSH